MKVNLYTQAVFASPSESFKDILPAGASHEWFVAPRLDRPKRNRKTDPIQTGTGDLRKVLLSLKHGYSVLTPVWPRNGFQVTHDEGLVVLLKLRKSATTGVRRHGCADGPLIHSLRLVFLEKCRSDERFEDKPTAKVDAELFDHCL